MKVLSVEDLTPAQQAALNRALADALRETCELDLPPGTVIVVRGHVLTVIDRADQDSATFAVLRLPMHAPTSPMPEAC